MHHAVKLIPRGDVKADHKMAFEVDEGEEEEARRTGGGSGLVLVVVEGRREG